MPPYTRYTEFIASEKLRGSANPCFRELTYVPDMEQDKPHYLKEWRKFRRMTQGALAEAIDTSVSVISDLERGVLQLSPKWLRKLAPVLETQPGHILDHDPADLDNDIIDIWAHIPKEDRDTARRVLRGFVRTGTDD